jgi:hypothetical protein
LVSPFDVAHITSDLRKSGAGTQGE